MASAVAALFSATTVRSSAGLAVLWAGVVPKIAMLAPAAAAIALALVSPVRYSEVYLWHDREVHLVSVEATRTDCTVRTATPQKRAFCGGRAGGRAALGTEHDVVTATMGSWSRLLGDAREPEVIIMKPEVDQDDVALLQREGIERVG